MMSKKITLGTLLLATLLLAPMAARAEEPKLVGTFGDWSAYSFTEDGNKVCYMASQPKKAEGNYSKRGEVFALITHRPSENTKNVFSYITGYSYKTGSDATLSIDKDKFTLFTQDDTAWAPDAATDKSIADSMRKGASMVIKGASSRGTQTIDTFSLKGSGAAHDAISKECGIE